MSLKSEDVNGFRRIKHMILERSDLKDIEESSLEAHELKALRMFREFEKQSGKRTRRIPVFG